MDARLCWRLPPELLFTPESLDFGCLPQHAKAIRELYVRNLSGPIDACSVLCTEDSGWLRVLCLQSVGGYEQACLRLTVEVDTSLLLPGRSHTGWMEVRLGECYQPIQVAVEVVAARMVFLERWRLARTILAPILVVVFLSGLLSWSPTMITKTLAAQLFPTLLAPHAEADPNLLVFSTYTDARTTLQLNAVARSGQEGWDITGWSPAWSPDGRQLLFISDRLGAPQLYLLPSAGGVPLQVTSALEPKFAPAWSPDGSKIAYLAEHPDQGLLRVFDSYTFSWQQSVVTPTTDDKLIAAVNSLFGQPSQGDKPTGVTTHFAWSPDSRALLFDYRKGEQVQILQVDANGAIVTVVTDSWSPTWSPDGKTIAAVSAEGLFRFTLGEKQRRQLSRRQAQAPAWSPTGDQLAFLAPQDAVSPAADAAKIHSTGLALWLVDSQGGQETLVSPACVAFAWSPDGRWLAYVTGDPQSASPLLYLWLIAPGAQPTLLAEIGAPTIAWKPINNY